ncbi:MAG: nucleotidyl transferase AbiEii/AbiGii toxin family protein [Paludibacter sp.]|nr:nucleotidyl transferase AbiEii/AbiGii toxin family protein [Paludibacter sp.]
MNDDYKKQVALLLKILPEVAAEKSFALHGGTAINLFELDMPRLSIDIDLTFTTIGEREKDLQTIRVLLEELKVRIQKRIPNIIFSDPIVASENLKINCVTKDATVKIEVNQINRGLMAPTRLMPLCEKTQEEFDSFCEMSVVSTEQLWGGKIIAALDRQHPRDLFDINNMLAAIGFTDDIKKGFMFFLLCSKRPIHEVLDPLFINQENVFSSQFDGMTDETYTYEKYEEVRIQLIETIRKSLSKEDKDSLLAFAKGEPNWDNVDYSTYPAVRWKLLNIDKLKKADPEKFQEQITLLEQILF